MPPTTMYFSYYIITLGITSTRSTMSMLYIFARVAQEKRVQDEPTWDSRCFAYIAYSRDRWSILVTFWRECVCVWRFSNWYSMCMYRCALQTRYIQVPHRIWWWYAYCVPSEVRLKWYKVCMGYFPSSNAKFTVILISRRSYAVGNGKRRIALTWADPLVGREQDVSYVQRFF